MLAIVAERASGSRCEGLRAHAGKGSPSEEVSRKEFAQSQCVSLGWEACLAVCGKGSTSRSGKRKTRGKELSCFVKYWDTGPDPWKLMRQTELECGVGETIFPLTQAEHPHPLPPADPLLGAEGYRLCNALHTRPAIIAIIRCDGVWLRASAT